MPRRRHGALDELQSTNALAYRFDFVTAPISQNYVLELSSKQLRLRCNVCTLPAHSVVSNSGIL